MFFFYLIYSFFCFHDSVPAGYWSARIYKVFRGKSWRLNSILTATVVPSGAIILLFASSMITWTQQSSLAISFYGWISLFAIWIFSVALTCIGAYFGDKTDRIEYPARTTQISRLIPTKRWYQANLIR
jgi:transmembrane 9 superfamily protein 2/4